MKKTVVRFKKLSEKAVAPAYASSGAAGADLYAAEDSDMVILSGTTQLIHTGIAVEIPEGYVGLVFARSGLASKKGLAPANKVGVIDSDYRGEILVPMRNQSNTAQTVAAGERIAQLVIVPYLAADFAESGELGGTERGEGGFGSTGTR